MELTREAWGAAWLDRLVQDLRYAVRSLRRAPVFSAVADERILSMLNTMMDISEAETGVLLLRREPVPLRALLAEVVELYEDVAEARKVTVTLEPGDELVVDGAREVFHLTVTPAPARPREVQVRSADPEARWTDHQPGLL